MPLILLLYALFLERKRVPRRKIHQRILYALSPEPGSGHMKLKALRLPDFAAKKIKMCAGSKNSPIKGEENGANTAKISRVKATIHAGKYPLHFIMQR